MKKIIVSIILLLALTSCDYSINYRIKIRTGDIRITETEEYIITERCKGCNGFGKPFWEKVSVEKKSEYDKGRANTISKREFDS